MNEIARKVYHSWREREKSCRKQNADLSKSVTESEYQANYAQAKKRWHQPNCPCGWSLNIEQEVVDTGTDQREIVKSWTVIIGSIVAINRFAKQTEEKVAIDRLVMV